MKRRNGALSLREKKALSREAEKLVTVLRTDDRPADSSVERAQ